MPLHHNHRKPFVFFLLTFAYAWSIWLPSMLVGLGLNIGLNMQKYTTLLVVIGAFAPMLAAITLVVRQDGWGVGWHFVRQAFDFRTKPIFFALAFGLPIVIHAVAHYLAPALGQTVAKTLLPDDLPVSPIVLAVPYFFLMLFVGGGQEEFGWRGYAQQPLQKRFGVIPASLLIGVIWGVWHLPLWVMPGEPHSTYPFLAFLVMTISIAVVYAWLYNASGQKLIVVMIFHAMNNTAAPLLPYLHWTEGKPETAYWVYAVVNVLAAVIAAILILRSGSSTDAKSFVVNGT